MRTYIQTFTVMAVCGGLFNTCSTSLPEQPQDGRHLTAPEALISSGIPDVVNHGALLPEPQARVTPELYSVVVQDVPVRELLFAIARDAAVNIDVHPQVTGLVSLNAIDQTLPQILDRIARQVDMRWALDASNGLMVERDTPFLRNYRVDYVNVTRNATTNLNVSTALTSVGGGGDSGGPNNSAATLSQSSSNNFWVTLAANLRVMLGLGDTAAVAITTEVPAGQTTDQVAAIVVNPEAGIISVRATARQHDEVRVFLDNIRSRSLYQVLIEATVVEVSLSDRYQAGVDWATLSRESGTIDFVQSVSGLNLIDAPASLLTIDRSSGPDAISATIRMLSTFGDIRVLSSPKIMALNNQAAMLRVVDNKVYFTVEVEPGIPATATTPATPPTYTSEIQTVPVGFVMTVTPQIGENDQVTLNVRPTISRIIRYVNDPSPALADAGVVNAIPEIQIREIESVLKVFSGEIAVLGGLMQDSLDANMTGLPGLSRLPGLRNLFSYRDDTAIKTELIVFIRPVVIRQPGLDGDLREYREQLPAGVGIPDYYNSRFDGNFPLR